MAEPVTAGLIIGGLTAGSQAYSQSQMRRQQRRIAEQNAPTINDAQRQSDVRSDNFEEESRRQRALIRSMRGNTASAGNFSLLNPVNSKLGG